MSEVKQKSELLQQYVALERASEHMLDAARAHNWDEVCRLEGACAVMTALLGRRARETPLQPHEQRERMRILRSILVNDAQIRQICQPVPAVLDAVLH